MEFTLVKEGTIPRACLDSMDGESFGVVIFQAVHCIILSCIQCSLLILGRQCMCGLVVEPARMRRNRP